MNIEMSLDRSGGTRHLENLSRLVHGEGAPPPIATLIGFAPTHVAYGHAVMEMEAEQRHANGMGTLHGGVLCDLADAAMGFAMASTLSDDESFTSTPSISSPSGTPAFPPTPR
jgi:acyl-coenzyme A thioesterase PaaI-like protein